MKYLLAAAIACGALFFAVPVVVGGNTDVCQDVSVSDVQGSGPTGSMSTSSTMYNVMNQADAVGSPGDQAHDKAARLHPHIPPAISCAAGFWKAL
jgi:hypothetical protein